MEIVIVDDGSTDASVQVIESYADERIRLFRQPPRGITKSLNFGLSQCKGEFVCRMDGDDICLPGRIERQVQAIRARHADIVWCTGDFIDENGTLICRRYQPGERFTVAFMHHMNHIMHPGVLLRRAAVLDVGGYDERVRHGQDQVLWLAMRKAGKRFALLREKLMLQRFHESNVTTRRFGSLGSAAQRNAQLSLKSRDTRRFFHHLRQVTDRGWQLRYFFRWLIGEGTIFWIRVLLRTLKLESLLVALRLISPQVSYAPRKD
jgi:glycosyltransferase involved in cell wall biosynthesis